MCKFFIYSTAKELRKVDILEISSSQEVKSIMTQIKTHIPKASFGVIGAKDFSTLRRTHRNLGRCNVTKSVDEFMSTLRK